MYYVMNTTIMPNPGKYLCVPISLSNVKFLLMKNDYISAIGHESTAKLLEKITGLSIKMNRITISLEPGDTMLVFKLKTRLEEGTILNEEELAKLEYEFLLCILFAN